VQILKYAAITALSMTLAVACVGGPASDEDKTGREKPSLFTSHSRNITATVEAIDHDTRSVTLLGPEGKSITFTAAEEVPDLVSIKAGDLVHTEYQYSLSIEVFDNQDLVPSEHKSAAMGRTGEGEMPALGTVADHTVTATIEAINIEAGTLKLKWPDETVDEFSAEDADNLRRVAVGDIVVITQTANLAVSVEKAAVE